MNELVDDASYLEFQKELLAMPDRGDVMQGSGGLMKVRMRLPGRGKSGGARVIYLYLRQYDVIILFHLDTKAKSETLTAAQLKSLKTAVAVIKQQFRPRRPKKSRSMRTLWWRAWKRWRTMFAVSRS